VDSGRRMSPSMERAGAGFRDADLADADLGRGRRDCGREESGGEESCVGACFTRACGHPL
jgi:hypothetical protein